jgi:hypothetical protein
MIPASALRHIPLDRLTLSPAYLRKTPPSAAAEAELKASIRAVGLKQNLVVHAVPKAKGRYAVVAGGRRLKVLQALAAEGAIPADWRVPCLVEKPDTALETALMENLSRTAMIGSALKMSPFCSRAVIAGLQKGPGISRRARQTSGSSVPAAKRGQRLTRRQHGKLVQGVQAKACTPATRRAGEREGNPSPQQ